MLVLRNKCLLEFVLAIFVAAWVKSKIFGQTQLNLSLFQPYEQCYNKCYVMYSLFKYRLIDVTLTPGDLPLLLLQPTQMKFKQQQ